MPTDPPEVMNCAAVLERLPRWYLALMLARVLHRKAPTRNGRGKRPERESVVVRTHGGGETVHSGTALSAGLEARSAPDVASSIWYWRPSGMRPASNHSQTLDCAQPKALAIADCVLKCVRRS